MSTEHTCAKASILAAINEKKRTANSIANMKALDYVRTNDVADRNAANAYLRDAALWEEAHRLVVGTVCPPQP